MIVLVIMVHRQVGQFFMTYDGRGRAYPLFSKDPTVTYNNKPTINFIRTTFQNSRPFSPLNQISNQVKTPATHKMTSATVHPFSGLWEPTQLQKMIYGPGSVQKHLKSCLPSEKSKAFIITGSSLAKTNLIKEVEGLLSSGNHAGTFSKIGQHGPVAQLDEATKAVQSDSNIDTIISIGGGSPSMNFPEQYVSSYVQIREFQEHSL
jgi:hypothetical protein